MKKMIFTFMVLSLSLTSYAQIDGFFPQFGQDAQWTVNDKFELTFTGSIGTAPAAAVATTFEGLVSNGIGGNDFTGINMKFDAFLDATGSNTTVLLSSDGIWGGSGMVVELSVWLIQVATNFTYDGTQKMVSSDVTTYQSTAKGGAYNAFEINVDASGIMSFKINNYTCPLTYTAPLTVLKASLPAERYAWFSTKLNGFKMKNLVVTKGTTTNKYFSDPAAGISKTEQANLSVFPNPTNGNFTLNSELIGKKYEITNIIGQQIQKGIIGSSSQKIDLKNQQAGNYLLIIDGNQGKVVRSIIKN